MQYELEIRFGVKKGTLDPESKTILGALHSLSFTTATDINMCRLRYIDFSSEEPEAALIERIKKWIPRFEDARAGFSSALHRLEYTLRAKEDARDVCTGTLDAPAGSYIPGLMGKTIPS